MKKNYRLLIVDDLKSIRIGLQDILSNNYDCQISSSGEAALKLLAKEKIDLMITDIRMPGMNGIELIRQARRKYPNLIYVLMTAYNTNEYLYYVRVEKIKNIIPKASISDLPGFKILIKKLLGEIDIFGINHYFPKMQIYNFKNIDFKSENMTIDNRAYTLTIHSLQEYRQATELIWTEFLSKIHKERTVALLLDELCSNVIQHLYFQKKFISKKEFKNPFRPPFHLTFGHYQDSIVISVVDQMGVLDQETILGTLESQINQKTIENKNESTLEGILRKGRGLFLSREMSDRLIFNIDKFTKTEVIVILSKEKIKNSTQPFSTFFIFENPKKY